MPPLKSRPTEDDDLENETSKDLSNKNDDFWTHYNEPPSEMAQNEEANTYYTELMEGVDNSHDVNFLNTPRHDGLNELESEPIATRLKR